MTKTPPSTQMKNMQSLRELLKTKKIYVRPFLHFFTCVRFVELTTKFDDDGNSPTSKATISHAGQLLAQVLQ